MVDKELAKHIDSEISDTQKALSTMPNELQKRTRDLGLEPKDLRIKIQQMDGVLFEFEHEG